MTHSHPFTSRRRVTGQFGIAIRLLMVTALGLVVPGCPPVDGGGEGQGTEPTGSINNLASNVRVSGEQSVTIVYSAGPGGAEVRGFYVEVESTDANASTIGLEVYFAEGLATGDNQTTTLSTAPMPVGTYRVGLDISANDQTLRVLSTGTIQVTTLPDPEFTLPNQDLFAQPGGNINISANVGDAENAVQWRIFYIAKDERPNAVASAYGTQIAAGSANIAQTTWFTAGVPLGEYEIGIFVTDSGQTIADTVASGNTDEINGPFFSDFIVTLTETPPEDIPPSVAVSAPANNQNILVTDPTDPDDGNVLVSFSVNVFQGPPALQFVDVFYDFDGIASTGDEQIISGSLPISATNAVFRVATIDVGTTAFIGVTANDGITDPVTRYAPGTVRRASFDDTVLNVTSPATTARLSPGDSLLVRWTLNAPDAAGGSTSVYFRRVDQDDNPLNAELVEADVVTNGLPINQQSFSFNVDASGRFIVTVKVDLDGDPQPLVMDAPAKVVVTTLPDIFWLNDLTSATAQFRGTRFGGVSFEDNAGSSFAGGEDFNNDGIDDFVIVSRYGKPEFANPSGIGVGEAYLIRGSANLAGKSFNLNTVSSSQLPGMTFTGVPIQSPTSSDESYGIASMYISSDADGDGVGELWFGMPFANFAVTIQQRTIEREGMFVHGGVVCVSSQNSRVQGSSDESGGRILLDQVGMLFNRNEVAPEPRNLDGTFSEEQANLCSSNTTWRRDLWRYYEGECPTGEAQTELPMAGCVPQGSALFDSADSDGGAETLVEPRHGFSSVLANNFFASTFFGPQRQIPCSNSALVRDNPCPSCFPADDNTCNGTCLQVEFVNESVHPDLLTHPSVELLDQSDTVNQFCSAIFDGTAFTVPGSFGPGMVDLPTLPEDGDCTLIKELVAASIQNPARTLLVDNADASGFESDMIDDYNLGRLSGLIEGSTFTGFYPDEYVADGAAVTNQPVQPFGMRIIGRQPTDSVYTDGTDIFSHEELSLFGTSITQVDDLMIISAPQRDAIDGVDANDFSSGVELEDAGILYTFDNLPYWQTVGAGNNTGGGARTPPKPHMFLAGGGGVTGFIGGEGRIPPGTSLPRWDLAVDREFTFTNGTSKVVGGPSENIEFVTSVDDFNGDGRNDIGVGSPLRNSEDGAVYVAFRRAPSLEGDFVLEKLALSTNDSERIDGILVTGDAGAGEQFGRVLASGVDFNNDGRGDLVVGVPLANGGIGEVVIIFSQTGIITPADGVSVETLLAQKQGARITGSLLDIGSEFGFTIANAGDMNGDGRDDLIIAAPSATPRFDPDPSDAVDQLTEFGLDRDRDGNQDNVSGPFGPGVPDFVFDMNNQLVPVIDEDDDLLHAGLVYVIFSSVDARDWEGPGGNYEIDIDELGSPDLPGFIIVGRNGERFAQNGVFVNGDYLGGGNAADTSQGGSADKEPIPAVGGDRGRGIGLAAAGDVDGDGFGDILIGAQLADPRLNPTTGEGIRNAGEVYLLFGEP